MSKRRRDALAHTNKSHFDRRDKDAISRLRETEEALNDCYADRDLVLSGLSEADRLWSSSKHAAMINKPVDPSLAPKSPARDRLLTKAYFL